MTAASGEPLVIVWSNCSHVTASMVELPQLIRRPPKATKQLPSFCYPPIFMAVSFLVFFFMVTTATQGRIPGPSPKEKARLFSL